MNNPNLVEEMRKISRDPLPTRSPSEIERLIDDLMSKMYLTEKIGQLYETGFDEHDVTGTNYDKSKTPMLIKQGLVGSIIGTHNQQALYRLQKIAVEDSRLGIPLLFAHDIIHGCKTSFPINLALACSFDADLVEKVSQATAFESSHSGVNMTFSPMVDLSRDPRWGRVMEGNGEDPYLSSVLATAYVKGYQQDDLTSYDTIAACVKHYIGYGAAEGGREYNTVDMSEAKLRQYYLPPFEAAVKAGAQSVMSAFNTINGVPASANKKWLKDVLKGELGFDGFVISDFTSTGEVLNHKIARDQKHVAEVCLNTGVDHEMIATTYIDYLEELVTEGRVSMAAVDDACRRVLRVKYRLGLFDNPYKNIYINQEDYWQLPEFLQLAREAAQQSAVLLENKNSILPLSPTTTQTIALIGPLGNSQKTMGGWNGKAWFEDTVTLYKGLQEAYPFANIIQVDGCDLEKPINLELDRVHEVVQQADIVILAVGESLHWSGEAHARANLDFVGLQPQMVEAVLSHGKRTIMVVFGGRPLILTPYKDRVDALVYAWLLGHETGHAIADLISGRVNFSGRLAMSFPYAVGQIPVYYNALPTGRPQHGHYTGDFYFSRYIDIPNEPLYPFGYGLTYSTVDYSSPDVSKKLVKTSGDSVDVSFTVTNTSSVAVYETVQLYIEALYYSVSRPVNELKRFEKVWLDAGESTTITFTLKSTDFGYVVENDQFTVEPVPFFIKVGPASNQTKKTEISLIEG